MSGQRDRTHGRPNNDDTGAAIASYGSAGGGAGAGAGNGGPFTGPGRDPAYDPAYDPAHEPAYETAREPGGEQASLGIRLARAREAAGLSVAELSELTRIRQPVIYAIERDDFSMTGGDFYSRGHIRNIAKAIGLDPEAVVHDYDEMHGGVPLPIRAADVFQADTPIKLRERHSFNWTAAMALLLVAVVGFGVVRMFTGSSELLGTGGRSSATPKAAAPAAKPRTTPYAKAAEAAPLAAADNVVVEVTAQKPTWLSVTDGAGKTLFKGTFERGNTSSWRAKKRLDVEVDDGSAVTLKVNGAEVGSPGRSGEHVHMAYGPSGGAR
jgi:cytoskeletal protein RodZ